MKKLQIVNINRELMAEVMQDNSGQITTNIIKPEAEADLKMVLETAKLRGLRYRFGGYQQDTNMMVDQQISIGPEHEHFLETLSQIIGQLKFANQRVFGLIVSS
jgi:hypothetical protein